MATDISNWTIVYPSTFVQLLKDRLNITKVNKAYYDSSSNSIIYRPEEKEAKCSRSQLREIRKQILKFLHHIPVSGLYISVSHGKHYRIRNPSRFDLSDEYTTFNFKFIGDRISSANVSLNSSLDDSYQFAFDNYYLKRLSIARDSFMHVANRYFSKSLFVKSLISSFNKKQLCFGEIPWESNENFIETSMEEQLSRNDNISEIIDRFPKSIVSRQKALFHGLDANNSFLLARFKSIATLSREIEDEINTINGGGIVFSNKVSSMHNQANCIALFVIKNKITAAYSSEYKGIAKIAFETIIKRLSLNGNIQIDILLSYLAAISFKEKDLVEFLSKNLIKNMHLTASSETTEHILTTLNNCLDAISSQASTTIIEHCSRVWSNHLIILSYMRHNQPTTNRIITHLAKAFDTNKWPELSETINRFLVLQVNRFESSFSVESLKLLLDKQVEKINSSKALPYQERGRLFSSLLYLIEKNNDNKGDLFNNNRELDKFIFNISSMEFSDRLMAINGFVFAIYYLATGELKNKTSDLLLKTFNEAKKRDLNESSIIFGLDLYNAGILYDKEDLKFILRNLQEKANDHASKGSTSSAYTAIKDQLSRIDAVDLQEFKDVIERVAELSDTMESRFPLFNKPQQSTTQ